MKTVSFANTEIGDDIIVSFYIIGDTGFMSDGYTIMASRCPKYEGLLPAWERRPRISNEKEDDGTGDDEFLELVEYRKKEKSLTISGASSSYKMSLRKLDESEIRDVLKGFSRLNYDQTFEITIIE